MTLDNCTITGNSAEDGAGIFLDHSLLEVFGVTRFNGNIADDDGGAL